MTMSHAATAAAAPSKGILGFDPPDELIARLLGSVNRTALAACLDLDRKTLYRFATLRANPSGEHRPLPFELAPILEITTGSTELAQWHCDAVGGLFVRPPRANASPASVLASTARLTEEFSGVQREVSRSLEDSVLTTAERRAIARHHRDLQAQAEALLMLVTDDARKPVVRMDAR